MPLVLYTVVAGTAWIVLWALGAKALDAALVGLLILLMAGAHQIVAPRLPGRQNSDT